MAGYNLLNINDSSKKSTSRDYSKFNNFARDVEGIEKLWRLADTRYDCNFRLRILSNGQLEEEVSLIELLPEFIENNINETFDEFDLFFSYMVYNIKRKIYPKNQVAISCFKVMCLKIKELLSRIRSDDDFFNMVAHIKITIRETPDPCHNHWELVYVDSSFHENKDLSDLLTSCCDPEDILNVPNKYDDPYFVRTFEKELVTGNVPDLIQAPAPL